ncbi:MAG TPA: universal stress protein [Candidatus Dormibacteraeota bacterium]|nr:universal stress protein [Candidatus Dormibacteraeota bacterium]
MYRKILVGLDRQGRAEQALPVVAALARRSLAEVVLLHVRAAGANGELPGAADVRLAAVVDRLEAEGVRAHAEVLATALPVPRAIVDAARRLGADLVALGSHGRGDLAGLVLGSVGHRVAARLDCPILLVHAGCREAGRRPIQRLLVAVDDSEEARCAVETAACLAAEHRAAVLVVHALQPESIRRRGYADAWNAASDLVEAASERFPQPWDSVQTLLLPGPGPVAARLAAAADTWDADLIVAGSRRLTDLGGLLLGSVAHDLVRRTRRPVLLADRAPAP